MLASDGVLTDEASERNDMNAAVDGMTDAANTPDEDAAGPVDEDTDVKAGVFEEDEDEEDMDGAARAGASSSKEGGLNNKSKSTMLTAAADAPHTALLIILPYFALKG